jgi:hypothetical protein
LQFRARRRAPHPPEKRNSGEQILDTTTPTGQQPRASGLGPHPPEFAAAWTSLDVAPHEEHDQEGGMEDPRAPFPTAPSAGKAPAARPDTPPGGAGPSMPPHLPCNGPGPTGVACHRPGSPLREPDEATDTPPRDADHAGGPLARAEPQMRYGHRHSPTWSVASSATLSTKTMSTHTSQERRLPERASVRGAALPGSRRAREAVPARSPPDARAASPGSPPSAGPRRRGRP